MKMEKRDIFAERRMEVKNLTLPFGNSEDYKIRDPQEAKIFEAPYSESDILELQDLFLAEGLHEIRVSSFTQGRQLIDTFLESLHCYYSPGCFTTQGLKNGKNIDIYKELQSKNIEVFFCENLRMDFLWIEMPTKIDEKAKCTDFIKKCQSLQLEKKMPILVVHQR